MNGILVPVGVLWLVGMFILALLAAIAFMAVHIGEQDVENGALRDALSDLSPEYAGEMEQDDDR